VDYHEAIKLKELSDEQIKRAKDYEKARALTGEAKSELDILLAAKFSDFRSAKKNLGYETSLIMLMEDNLVARELYREMIENEARYKSLERIIEAIGAKISLCQSIMKYVRENG